MPLGLFSSNSSKDGPKPQPLTSEKEERTSSGKRDKSGSTSGLGIDIKDSKGSTFKLGKKSYTVEKKLAEGGFALVYLVCDKHGRNYALKRQLIRDDARQVEACRTESQIVKNLNGHKNIVAYIDHQLTVNKAGVYDYMLLTVYYPTNVLQLMNSRLLSNRCLSCHEILDIFCDVCEAVARLHHSKTPVIHRDLKVENVLIDQRTGSEKQVYVLCDFGSATTKVLSKETHTQAYMEEEIQRYTTLSYRAPEMIDVFSGIPIDTKSDIWALGILLYKLCYFSLPFGESALAIQNGTFTFPDAPNIPDELKAIMNLLLTLSAKHRPNIFQTSYLVFAAANRKCPVYNIEKGPRIELAEAVQILRLRDKLGSNYARLFEKAFNEFEEQKRLGKGVATNEISPPNTAKQAGEVVAQASDARVASNSQVHISSSQSSSSSTNNSSTNALVTRANEQLPSPSVPAEGVIVNTATAGPRSSTTSVNPRLRPKATTGSSTSSTVANRNNVLPSPFTVGTNMSVVATTQQQSQILTGNAPTSLVKPSTSSSNLNYFTASIPADTQANASSSSHGPSTPKMSLQHNQTPRNMQPLEPIISNTEDFQLMKLSQISTDSSKSAPTEENAFHNQQIVFEKRTTATLPANAPSCLRSSAFQPYTIASSQRRMGKPAGGCGEDKSDCTPRNAPYQSSSSMPVPVASAEGIGILGESSNPFIMTPGSPPTAMDDNVFGERFDELRRVNRRNTIEAISGPEGTKKEFDQHYQPTQKTLSVCSPPHHQQHSPFQMDLDCALEKAYESDPFGCAPALLPSQLYYLDSGGGSGTSSGDKLSSGAVGVAQRL